jgi:hypothetical protein
VRKALNSGTTQDREDEEAETVPGTFQNVPSTSIFLGARSEITDFSNDGIETGPQSEITDISTAFTSNSRTPLTRINYPSRIEMFDTSTIASHRSRLSRRATLTLSTTFVKPVGQFSKNVKDRGKLVWELLKLNYRMLISLTLTLFVAIFVSLPHICLTLDLRQLAYLPTLPQQSS